MKSLSDKVGLLVIANFFKYAVGFALPIILVRLLSQTDYGTYQQLLLVGATALGVMTLGFPTSIYYFFHHVSENKRPALLAQTSLMLACSALLAAVAVALLAQPIADRVNNPAVAELLPIYAISIFFIVASDHSIYFLIAQNRYKLAVGLEVGETIVRVSLLLLPIWLGYGLFGVIVGIVSYSSLRCTVRLFYLYRSDPMGFAGWTTNTFFGPQLGYSLPLALVPLMGVVSMTVNRGLLATSFTPAEYAIYTVGALEIPLDVIFQASVAHVLRASLPPLVRDGNLVEVVRVMREAVRKLSIIMLPSFVFLSGNAETLISALFTNRYVASVPIFQIYLWLVPLHMFILSSIPLVFGKPRISLYVNIMVHSTLIIASYVLLQLFGFYGPALAVVGSQYLGVFAFLIVAKSLTKASISDLLPLVAMFRVVLASLGALFLSQLADPIFAKPLLNFVVSGVVFTAAFFLIGMLIRVFTRDDLELAKRWGARLMPRSRR